MADLVTRIRHILDEQEQRPGRRHRRSRRWSRRWDRGPSRVRPSFGTPSSDLTEAPPSADQEANMVLSGGGVVRRDGRGPARWAERS